jgi:hypothetical protein
MNGKFHFPAAFIPGEESFHNPLDSSSFLLEKIMK